MISSLINSVIRMTSALSRRFRAIVLRSRGVKLKGASWLRAVDIPSNHAGIELGDGVAIERGCTLLVTGEATSGIRLQVEEGVYINRGTMIAASEHVLIGRDAMIGPNCYITDHDHGLEPGLKINEQPLNGSPVRVGADVWVGANVTILKGVTIGDHAVVGAGSVVTRDVPEGAVVAGVPARVLRMRDMQGQNETAE